MIEGDGQESTGRSIRLKGDESGALNGAEAYLEVDLYSNSEEDLRMNDGAKLLKICGTCSYYI